MLIYIFTFLFLFTVLAGWVCMKKLARDFARDHPEFGSFREEGDSCGACAGGGCAGRCHEIKSIS